MGLVCVSAANAVEVISARHDVDTNSIVAELRFGGGLSDDHKFRLKLDGACAESFPVQCSAEIIHSTTDRGEALRRRTVSLSLADAKIQGDYFQDAKITVRGKSTFVVVRLNGIPAPSKVKADEECVSHTGSKIQIISKNRLVTVTSTEGEKSEITILKTTSRLLESNPTQFKTTYELKDGRSLITVYRGHNKTGTGQWLRVDGSYSPEFKCKNL